MYVGDVEEDKRREMRGVGGPLLCISDLLSDVGEGDGGDPSSSLSISISNPNDHLPHLDLCQLFQEDYNQLNEALAGTDHSWTALTLKLCSVLETADKLVQSANSNIKLLLEKVGMIESIVRRGDSAIAAGKAIHSTLNKKGPSTGSQNNK